MNKEFALYYGISLFIISVVLIVRPSLFLRMNKVSGKVVFTDSELFRKPKISGMIFILVGVALMYSGYLYRDFL